MKDNLKNDIAADTQTDQRAPSVTTFQPPEEALNAEYVADAENQRLSVPDDKLYAMFYERRPDNKFGAEALNTQSTVEEPGENANGETVQLTKTLGNFIFNPFSLETPLRPVGLPRINTTSPSPRHQIRCKKPSLPPALARTVG